MLALVLVLVLVLVALTVLRLERLARLLLLRPPPSPCGEYCEHREWRQQQR